MKCEMLASPPRQVNHHDEATYVVVIRLQSHIAFRERRFIPLNSCVLPMPFHTTRPCTLRDCEPITVEVA